MQARRRHFNSLTKAFFILFFAIIPFLSKAQVQRERSNSYWLVAKLDTKLSSKWSAFIELEERRFISPERALQRSLPYVGISYKGKDQLSLGFAYLNFTIFSPSIADLPVENNILEQRLNLWATYRFGPKKRFSIRLKHEYRLFDLKPDNGDLEFKRFINRWRIMLAYAFPLNKNWSLKALAELLVNYMANTSFKYFDQNRLYLGVKHKLSDKHSLELGYLHWYQENRTTDLFFDRHIVRLGWVYTLDLKSKDQT